MNSGGKMFVTSCFQNQADVPLFLFTCGPSVLPNSTICSKKNGKGKWKTSKNVVPTRGYKLISDPRVCRGNYVMNLGPTNDPNYNSCFEMVRKDPLCQLYLKGLNKCSDSNKSKPYLTTKTQRTKMQSTSDLTSTKLKALSAGLSSSTCQTDDVYEQLLLDPTKTESFAQTDTLRETDHELLGREKQVPVKIGDDQATQVQPGELWNFNEAVNPVVENLTGAVIEQALIELVEEEELSLLRGQQVMYENRKKSEMDRLLRLAARQQSLVDENTRLIQQSIIDAEKARQAGEAISAVLFTKSFLRNILCDSMDEVRKDGALRSSESKDSQAVLDSVEDLSNGVSQLLNSNSLSRALLDDIIKNAVQSRSQECSQRI